MVLKYDIGTSKVPGYTKRVRDGRHTSITLSPETAERIVAHAAESKVSRAAAVKELIEWGLERSAARPQLSAQPTAGRRHLE